MRALLLITSFIALLPSLASAYCEEDWRVYSRTKVALVDSFALPVAVAGPCAVTGSGLVFLTSARDAVVYVDATTHQATMTQAIPDGHNLDISAMTAWQGALYVLSRTTMTVYVVAPNGSGVVLMPICDLHRATFDGEPKLDAFAFDGQYVYMIMLADFNTHILRIKASTGLSRFFAYATGRPTALWCDSTSVYLMAHRNVANSRPILTKFAMDIAADHREAAQLLDIELPCEESVGFYVSGSAVRTVEAASGRVATMVLK